MKHNFDFQNRINPNNLKDLVKDMLDSDIKIARLNQQKWKKTVLFFLFFIRLFISEIYDY